MSVSQLFVMSGSHLCLSHECLPAVFVMSAPTCVCHMSGSQLYLSHKCLPAVFVMSSSHLCLSHEWLPPVFVTSGSQLCLSRVAPTCVCHMSSCHLCSMKGCSATTCCEQGRVSLSTQAITVSPLSVPCSLGRLKPQLTRSSLPSRLTPSQDPPHTRLDSPSQDPPHTRLDSPSVPVFWCPWQQQVMS